MSPREPPVGSVVPPSSPGAHFFSVLNNLRGRLNDIWQNVIHPEHNQQESAVRSSIERERQVEALEANQQTHSLNVPQTNNEIEVLSPAEDSWQALQTAVDLAMAAELEAEWISMAADSPGVQTTSTNVGPNVHQPPVGPSYRRLRRHRNLGRLAPRTIESHQCDQVCARELHLRVDIDEDEITTYDKLHRSLTRAALRVASIKQRLQHEVYDRLDRNLLVPLGLQFWLTWYLWLSLLELEDIQYLFDNFLRFWSLEDTEDPDIVGITIVDLDYGPYDEVEYASLIHRESNCQSEMFSVRQIESSLRLGRFQIARQHAQLIRGQWGSIQDRVDGLLDIVEDGALRHHL